MSEVVPQAPPKQLRKKRTPAISSKPRAATHKGKKADATANAANAALADPATNKQQNLIATLQARTPDPVTEKIMQNIRDYRNAPEDKSL